MKQKYTANPQRYFLILLVIHFLVALAWGTGFSIWRETTCAGLGAIPVGYALIGTHLGLASLSGVVLSVRDSTLMHVILHVMALGTGGVAGFLFAVGVIRHLVPECTQSPI